MTFKKIMLLASMAMAAVAFAAPAAQASPEWFHNGVRVKGPGQAKVLHVTGKLSSEVIETGGFTSGPCEVTFEGEAWNENNMADGVITGGSIQHICNTNAPGCTITPTLENFPWNITGTTVTDEENAIEITGAQFTNHYIGGAACPVPVSTIMATGTATGIVEPDESGKNSCLDFENHIDHLTTHAPLPTLTVDIEGTVCDTTLTLD